MRLLANRIPLLITSSILLSTTTLRFIIFVLNEDLYFSAWLILLFQLLVIIKY